MSVDYFVHQEIITKNLILFMREKGCSRLSFSKLIGVTRIAVDQLLNGWNGDASEYNALVEKIRLRFDLPNDFFLKEVAFPQPSTPKLSPEVQKLRDGLENILDIYSMHIK
ncbi:MAG: hypothetical protein KID09_21205 [Paenibacillus macerans]|uniref:hypothetical protein n=1 Tax=Paenibacillus macerans TaxID=44252 RepID=UPI002432509A|nr:hypothetical protein [Paenibacillus macerans]MBS5913107.1 hypothetical protein [Paenibacillus macerans]